MQEAKPQLLAFLQQVIIDNKFNYETFGKEIEKYLVSKIIEILTTKGIIKNDSDYHLAPNKNHFPELTLYTDPNLAIELKSGNHFKKTLGRWGTCKNSENDMGTLNSWGDKLEKFGGDNIYYFFIEYGFNDKQEKIIDVKFEPFYKFLFVTDGILKYREKDGNLRPKDFDKPSLINSFPEFQSYIEGTEIYRSKRIVKKHFQYLPLKDMEEIYKELEIILAEAKKLATVKKTDSTDL
ncbi:MAG: hypothetical protein JSS91_00730 [Bacteroidetes bacterium]|nr:hypothetical protein [Bacteroidota bacterium]